MKTLHMNIPGNSHGSRQQGFALIACLIVLLVLTVLGSSAMQGSVMQERMAGHVRDRDLAFQAAEAALREAEEFLGQATLPTFNGTNGLYQPAASGSTPVWESIDWSADARTYAGTLPGVDSAPVYIIEELPATQAQSGSAAADEPSLDAGFYRITVRAAGGSDTAVVVLQSTFRR